MALNNYRQVHLSHCNMGDYVGTCKYGDLDCPALSKSSDLELSSDILDKITVFGEGDTYKFEISIDKLVDYLMTLERKIEEQQETISSITEKIRDLVYNTGTF